MLRAVIFDFDGVLADTEPLHFRAFRDVLGFAGFELTEAEYFTRYVGLNDAAFLAAYFTDRKRELSDAERHRLQSEKDGVYFSRISHAPPPIIGLPLIRELAARVPIAICSGARRVEIESILKIGGIKGLFEFIISADDCPVSKPEPAGYIQSIERLRDRIHDLQSSECLAVEDSLNGIRAARAAGLKVIAVGERLQNETARETGAWAASLASLNISDVVRLFEADYRMTRSV